MVNRKKEGLKKREKKVRQKNFRENPKKNQV